jgi:hypothetical protein
VQPGGRELQQCDLEGPWRVARFVEQDEYDRAALASLGPGLGHVSAQVGQSGGHTVCEGHGARSCCGSAEPLLKHLKVPDRVPMVLPLLLEDHVQALQHGVVFPRVAGAAGRDAVPL